MAVISYGYWERQLARSPGAVGQTVQINGVPVTIVGVSPRGFVGATVGSIADITMAVAALPQVEPQRGAAARSGQLLAAHAREAAAGRVDSAGDRASQCGVAARYQSR